MNTMQASTTFNRSVYRDFALFALAAVGVGLAVSLTLATAVVLAAPDSAPAASTDKTERAAEGPKAYRTRLADKRRAESAPCAVQGIASIQHPAAS
jgi:hypothetical protein